MNTKMYYSIGMAIAIFNALLLLGVFKAIFQVDVNTNLFNTSITPGLILGLANVFLIWGIYKKRI